MLAFLTSGNDHSRGVSAMHMHSYWIGIMAIAFVITLVAWILLVFNADRHPRGRPHESLPHRDVIGGEFSAREGGRQLMPHPNEPDPEVPGPRQPAEHRPAKETRR